jgi:hypothetical protein
MNVVVMHLEMVVVDIGKFLEKEGEFDASYEELAR